MTNISIIIPIYNVEEYLAKCLDSVLVDNEFTGQVICVNDGSTDGSLSILEQYAHKYPNIEIISQPNAGLSAARNTGLRAAKGEYVLFLDSDDWLFPDVIQKMTEQIDGEDVLYFNARKYNETTQIYDSDCAIEEVKKMKGQSYFATIYGRLRNVSCVCVWGGVYNRRFLMQNNLWNEPGIYHEDNYFTPQVLLAAENVSSVNEYVYAYRIREGSITAHVTKKHIKDLLYIARNLYATYDKRQKIAIVFYHDVCNIYINLIKAAYEHSIPIHSMWRISDSIHMLRCAYDLRSSTIAKLTFFSQILAYRYMQDTLPPIVRRIINNFV